MYFFLTHSAFFVFQPKICIIFYIFLIFQIIIIITKCKRKIFILVNFYKKYLKKALTSVMIGFI